jgi:hypothetical protein
MLAKLIWRWLNAYMTALIAAACNTIRNEIVASDLWWNPLGHHRLIGAKYGADEALVFVAQLRRASIQVALDPQNDQAINIDSFGQITIAEAHRADGATMVRDANGVEQHEALNCTDGPDPWRAYCERTGLSV